VFVVDDDDDGGGAAAAAGLLLVAVESSLVDGGEFVISEKKTAVPKNSCGNQLVSCKSARTF
jgi:hypothetical protein